MNAFDVSTSYDNSQLLCRVNEVVFFAAAAAILL